MAESSSAPIRFYSGPLSVYESPTPALSSKNFSVDGRRDRERLNRTRKTVSTDCSARSMRIQREVLEMGYCLPLEQCA
jgi:hypothetical protein